MKPKLEDWYVARGAIVAISLFCAVFAIYYWASPLWATNKPLAIAVAIGFGVSALITPCVVPKLFHTRGIALAGLLATCAVFSTVDSIGVAGGFLGLEKDLTQAEFDSETKVYTAERLALSSAIEAKQTAIDALPSMADVCVGHGPQNCAARQKGLTDDRGLLLSDRDAAQGRLDVLAKPERADRFNDDHMTYLSFAIQIVLAFGLIALEAARHGKFNREMQAYQAVLAERRAEREKKQKAKARAGSRKPAKPAAPKRQEFKPYVIAANDA
ncbi:MAG: hypothetical protein QNI84_14060 [Henriciella sp.]|nr:hypothetical protein [Henriciella sp.]